MGRHRPVIIVAAYNRPRSLERLLGSLKQAKNISGAKLIISIDNHAPRNYDVRDIAMEFDWPFGEKEVAYQKNHLGLRAHILQCGDLALQYGSAIILEDDLFVSPWFYEYAVKALDFYENDPVIRGISLYDQPVSEVVHYPFAPVYDHSDVYFLHFPSSYGQAWSADHWKEFRAWYDEGPDLDAIRMPSFIRNWPETSWKKYFCGFLTAKEKYFVFPRMSLTSNFNDPGTNLKSRINHEGQSQLRLTGEPYRFIPLEESYCRYDAYFELEPATVKQFNSRLSGYEFEMDLYGAREPAQIRAPYVVTSRPCRKKILSFKRALKPHEMNVLYHVPGDDMALCRTEDMQPEDNLYGRKLLDHKYFYTRRVLGWKVQLYNYYHRFIRSRKGTGNQ